MAGKEIMKELCKKILYGAGFGLGMGIGLKGLSFIFDRPSPSPTYDININIPPLRIEKEEGYDAYIMKMLDRQKSEKEREVILEN